MAVGSAGLLRRVEHELEASQTEPPHLGREARLPAPADCL